ncbi:MFS transporter, partial [Cupriavidus pinatubonensis]
GQAVACAGVSVLNVQLPALIKGRFPAHIGLLTGVYSMALSAGAALGS